MNLGKLKTAVVLGLPAVVWVYCWMLWRSTIDMTTHFTDYWGIFWAASGRYGLSMWLGQVTVAGGSGSNVALRYVPLAFTAVLLIYVAQSLWHRLKGEDAKYLYVWINLRWFVVATAWVLIATAVASLAHYLNLYIMPVPECGPNFYVIGDFDDITHFWSTGMLMVVLVSVDWAEIIGWKDSRRTRLYEAILLILVIGIIMLIFEHGESSNPALFINPFWDSVRDQYIGYLSALIVIMSYNHLIPPERD